MKECEQKLTVKLQLMGTLKSADKSLPWASQQMSGGGGSAPLPPPPPGTGGRRPNTGNQHNRLTPKTGGQQQTRQPIPKVQPGPGTRVQPGPGTRVQPESGTNSKPVSEPGESQGYEVQFASGKRQCLMSTLLRLHVTEERIVSFLRGERVFSCIPSQSSKKAMRSNLGKMYRLPGNVVNALFLH